MRTDVAGPRPGTGGPTAPARETARGGPLEPVDAHGRRRAAAGKQRALVPREEEGKRRLGARLGDPGRAPAQDLAGRRRTRAGAHGQAALPGDAVEVVRSHGPAERSR